MQGVLHWSTVCINLLVSLTDSLTQFYLFINRKRWSLNESLIYRRKKKFSTHSRTGKVLLLMLKHKVCIMYISSEHPVELRVVTSRSAMIGEWNISIFMRSPFATHSHLSISSASSANAIFLFYHINLMFIFFYVFLQGGQASGSIIEIVHVRQKASHLSFSMHMTLSFYV